MPVFSNEDLTDDLFEGDDKVMLQYYFTNKDFKNYVDEREHWNENLITYWQGFKIFEKKKVKKDRVIKFCWITIQDFQRRMEDIEKLQHFMSKINYLYEDGHWVIESGKTGKNVHIHMLVKIINEKKHKQMLCIEWGKLFNSNLRDKDYYKLKQHRDVKGMPSYKQWVDEKLEYMSNDNKGTHMNSIELNLAGGFGVSC